ncbi:hypothetical protein ACF1G5_04455 [Streptomyces coeruleorubidus]|uniref:hypothetical protein n=1 Tax=Streptomyces coeruleorubidus TaxID=116188 RepID=UPI0036F6BCE8
MLSAVLLGMSVAAAPAASAATVSGTTASAAPGCVTGTKEVSQGYGTIIVCVNEDGSARAYGDLHCTAFGATLVMRDIGWQTASGVKYSTVATAGWGYDDIEFDADPSAGPDGIKGITGGDEIHPSTIYMCTPAGGGEARESRRRPGRRFPGV